MLLAAFDLWLVAVVLGAGISLFYLGVLTRRSWIVAALHGTVAAAGLIVLVLALKGPMRGFANGVEFFGKIAAGIAAATLAIGQVFLFVPKARRGWIIGTHATLGICAFVFLSGYLLLG